MVRAAGPTFLGIGAQKAGTTWLHAMLALHPDVGMPQQKELHFWDRETPDADSIGRYLDRFTTLRGTAHGEITPSYAILPPERIALIRRHLPDLALLYVLRDPVERAWSHARMDLGRYLREHHQPPRELDAWLDSHFRSDASLARGDYAACLANWREHYDHGQPRIFIYEEAFAAPREFLKHCAAAIGVTPRFYDGIELAGNVYPEREILKTERVALPPETHARHAPLLRSLYAPRVEKLAAILGRPLPWALG